MPVSARRLMFVGRETFVGRLLQQVGKSVLASQAQVQKAREESNRMLQRCLIPIRDIEGHHKILLLLPAPQRGHVSRQHRHDKGGVLATTEPAPPCT